MNSRVAIISLGYYDKPRYFEAAMEAIAHLDYPRHLLTWVIVDNSCHGPSAAYVRERILPRSGKDLPEVVFLENDENLGFAKGNNQGMRVAMERGCDYVFLLNHDAKPGVDAIKESVRVAEAHKDAGAVQPMLLLWQKPDRLNSSGNDVHFLGFGLTRDFGKYRTDVKRTEGEEIGYASGAGVLYRVAALKEVGLLEEYFWMYHEDLELGWRLRLAGWKSVLAPTAFVYHDYEFHRSTKKMYWMERNRLLTHLSHLSPRSFLLLAPALLLIEKVVFVGACMNGWGREKWRSWGWVFDRSAWQYIARAHADVRRLRRVDDREACAIFVGRIEHQGVDHVLVRRLLNPLLAAYWGVVKRLL